MHWAYVVGITLLSSVLTAAGGQTPDLDPAVLAKANAGDATAQVAVGLSYIGKDVSTRSKKQADADYKAAAEWFRKAAEQGNIAGEMKLASLYSDGLGLARDMVQAASWVRKAAEQGDVEAQGKMGVFYSFGQGVAQDYVEAYFWLDLAASVKGPNQEKYAANRQMIGSHITTDELDTVQERVAAWMAAHPRPAVRP